jgi:hypothetical protein
MGDNKQIWQDRIYNDILNSDQYDKKYTLPRGSGATTFTIRLVRELYVLLPENAKVLVVVRNSMIRSYVNSMLPPGQNNITIVDALTSENVVKGLYTSYIDWLIVDGVEKESSPVLRYIFNDDFHINNRLELQTC